MTDSSQAGRQVDSAHAHEGLVVKNESDNYLLGGARSGGGKRTGKKTTGMAMQEIVQSHHVGDRVYYTDVGECEAVAVCSYLPESELIAGAKHLDCSMAGAVFRFLAPTRQLGRDVEAEDDGNVEQHRIGGVLVLEVAAWLDLCA